MIKRPNPSFRERIAFEKQYMPRLQSRMAHVVVPLYVLTSLVLLVVIPTVMDLDDENLVPALICGGIWLLLTICLLSAVPPSDRWFFHEDGYALEFDAQGVVVDGKRYDYCQLRRQLGMGNEYNGIWLYLEFSAPDGFRVTMRLGPSTLKMVECLPIDLENQEVLDYILENKEKAFERVLRYGIIQL